MKVHPCAERSGDGRILGKACTSALVVFGPYVTVPANSDVQLRFDIESPSELRLTSDVISNTAKQFHGALDEQLVRANEKRSIGYRLHVFDAASTLEARIGVRANAPVDFTISNLSLSIN